ncbi:MAG: DUF1731 domain-containing protein, partial [Tolypothrix sp. T3-bin4]|nr:DUF1731 domain-containing protein [Tolypothrix sp. T3-bin4]
GVTLFRPSWLTVLGFAFVALVGEGSKIFLEGLQVLPKNNSSYGFKYQYLTVKEALAEILTSS